MPSIVILYTRMPGYLFNCLKYFSEQNSEYRIYCLCYPPSKEAPFAYTKAERVRIEYINEIDNIDEWIDFKSPSLILVSGWGNKTYLKACKKYISKIPVVLGMDNFWHGNIKQRIFALFSKIYLKQFFNKIWVPGELQFLYAKKLGFHVSQIKKGLYCKENIFAIEEADMRNERYANKELLFVGRFVEYKRPDFLADTFLKLYQEGRSNNWKLTLIGNGPLRPYLLKRQSESNGKIKVLEFQQPEILKKYFQQSSGFCLPSKGEHWGVVVHEAVSMALPVLLSDTCGSHADFLANGKNGFLFDDKNDEDFKDKLTLFLSMTEDELCTMGMTSKEKSKTITISQWNNTMLELLNQPL